MESIETNDGFTVTSSDESADDMRTALAIDELPDPDQAKEPAKSEPEPEKSAAPVKIDKRTREGRKSSIQQEIDELTTVKHKTKREVDEAQSQVATLRAEFASLSAQRQPAAQPKPAVQAPAKFPSYQDMLATEPNLTPEDWLDKRDEWRDGQRAAAAERSRQQQEIATKQQGLVQREQELKKTVPDYDQRVAWLLADFQRGAPYTLYMKAGSPIGDILAESPVSAQMLLHFADHREDLQRLVALPPLQCLRETTKLEAELRHVAASNTGPARTTPVISQAHAPLKPVSAGAPISDDSTAEEDLPLDEFVRRGNAKASKLHAVR